ncbi:dTDP-glucose 4,6-dehydratase [Halobacillus andaensis]|uniref:dTDP-glucose 4,6-dehydratase n=1 Tax=Halobacillus andaensis TaxID=1176239 RepID=A0A917B7D2_HALAA|nr:dTDP-glucose 4,6-dehydratase [Halobacillus andaensis]MBP2005197.1 dTDP-glucose 4,6-dehydratase [Halobacillus andaensis]GGF29605.1 dTDP-glucose 4,6-dehydratase [Halobacillus andaensis]
MNRSKPLLVTGGAGFIGSNFIKYYLDTYPNVPLVNVDKLTYAGSTSKVKEVESHENYHFIHGDITDEKLIHQIFEDFPIKGIIHFAAESHVDRSIEDASSFIDTNVKGTMILLQAAKHAWEQRGELKTARFHQISTDEVYGSLDDDGKFNEHTPYDPRNPYSASKAGANLLVKSFGYTYGMNVVLSSSSNNYGPNQHVEKLIPTIISNALNHRSIPIYGDGKNIRDWLYVEDHCRALDLIFHHGKSMESFNVGGGNEMKNIDLAAEICEILDQTYPAYKGDLASFKELITFTKDRLGHDRRYAVDDTKLRGTLGWQPIIDMQQGLQETVEWYVDQWTPLSR